MSEKPDAKADAPDAEGESKGSAAGLIIGWVVLPLAFVGAIFAGGVYVGAHYPLNPLTQFVRWLVG